MALFLYRLLFILLTPVLLLALLFRSFNHKEYRHRLFERLGLGAANLKSGGVIVHAASVGEVIAIKAFVEELLSQHILVTVTTFTPTGSAQVIKQFNGRVQHCYLPLDIWPCTYYFLQKLKPSTFVLMETELWPNIIAQSKKANIPLLLINARLSTKSMQSYLKIKPLITPALLSFDRILCQSEENYNHFLALGASATQCEVSGNLKFDIAENEEISTKAHQLAQLLPQDKQVWLVASTHDGDEELMCQAYKLLLEKHPELLLVVVPRHPERFSSVVSFFQVSGFQTEKRSSNIPLSSTSQVWVIDTLGELMSAYQLADIVTIGGSFSTIGGHNPLEPALFKKPIIVGHDMSNFTDIEQQLLSAQGLIKLTPQDSFEELAKQLFQLLELPNIRNTLGTNAFKVVLANQGASKKSADALSALLSKACK